MKHLKNISLATVTVIVLLSVNALAQPPAFSGNWKLKERILVSGKNYDNALAPLITYAFKGDSVTVRKAGDPENIRINYQTTDRGYLPGKKQVTVNDKDETTQRYFTWLDGKKSWELVTAGSQAGKADAPEYQFRDVWTYDSSADVLRVEMTFKSESDPTDFCTFKGVYERIK
jgi:hypothetical protein